MLQTTATRPVPLRLGQLGRVSVPAMAVWLLSFLLVVYVALKGGGYDAIVRSEIGVAVWWVVLVGAVAGVLPAARIGRAGWLALGLLAAFGAWTALGIGWSESAERSVAELGRVAVYAGVLALALAVQGRDMRRHAVNGLAAAIGLVAVLAVLSRLHPAWFPANDTAAFLPSTQGRLSYPLNYWNGLAALIALGLPLMLWVASSARSLLTQTCAAAALPIMVLGLFLTLSRAGALAAAVALIVFFTLSRDRLPKLGSLLLAAAGSAILIGAVIQRPALLDGLETAAARQQGDEIIVMALVVCAGVALLQATLGLALRHGRRPRWLSPSRGASVAVLAVAVVVALAAATAGGAWGELSSQWESFKDPDLGVGASEGATIARLESTSGNGRYQYWESALEANATAPLVGIGPGTYEFWWAREGTIGGFIRDAHSLYFQLLAEVGIVGLALLLGFVAWVLAVGVARVARASPRTRDVLAAATAGCAAFATSAAFDWVWQVAVIPLAFLLLAAVIVAPNADRRSAVPRRLPLRGDPRAGRRDTKLGPLATRFAPRAVLAALALVALVPIMISLVGSAAVRASQAEAAANRLEPAIAEARSAERIQPYAATPAVQRALLLEADGAPRRAVTAARAATSAEPTNWRTWLVRARLEAGAGNAEQALRAYRRARSLNPRSPIFAR